MVNSTISKTNLRKLDKTLTTLVEKTDAPIIHKFKQGIKVNQYYIYKHNGEWKVKDNTKSFKNIERIFASKIGALSWCTAKILNEINEPGWIEYYDRIYGNAINDILFFKMQLEKIDISEFKYDLYKARHDAAVRRSYEAKNQLLRIAKSLKI